MKIIVLGGDGFCGWPTSLYLSSKNHDVTIIDNLSRRNIDNELSAQSLTPISSITTRLKAWNEKTNRIITYHHLDIAHQYTDFMELLYCIQPEVIVHFAEQRAAPYSMKSAKHKRYTIDNNINGTHNILCSIVESQLPIHLVHLGSTGVYGYGSEGCKIPEGYLQVQIEQEGKLSQKEIVYPYQPGSIYHMSKCMDNLMFHYYAKNDRLAITDLHQGIVWGINTNETILDERLINRFDYDGDYGTVLNRFLMQAATNHFLTIYGTGEQTRAFIHIKDTIKCIEIAIQNPPTPGDQVKIFNQLAQTFSVVELAKSISNTTGVPIKYIENPRVEATKNSLMLSNQCFLDKGLDPILFSDNLFKEIIDIAKKYQSRIDLSKILCHSYWRKK